jgi:hypothetical protein
VENISISGADILGRAEQNRVLQVKEREGIIEVNVKNRWWMVDDG